MNKLINLLLVLVFGTNIVLFILFLTHGHTFQILDPKGFVAIQERNLLITAVLLMLIVVIPVFILAFFVATKYKETNTTARYTPDWDSTKLQVLCWSFLFVDICILSSINWVTAHQLDPHKALVSATKPITIQVIALRWKWLFIYPEQGIATVNYVAFPEKTPLNFQLTAADTPMNSFWIPQLGGQIYAMSGMATQTHLIADTIGTYPGSNAEINGAGFANMTFTAKSVSKNDFDAWIESVKHSPKTLTLTSFNTLSEPTESTPPTYFSSTEDNLYTTIVMKYMARPTPSPNQNNENQMPDMKM